MKLRSFAATFAAALLLASCGDEPTPSQLVLPDGPTPNLDVVDGSMGVGGNGHFFWLSPLSENTDWPGIADPSLDPVVEICLRNAAGDGCASGPLLATFTRGKKKGGGDDDDRSRGASDAITVDRRGHYSVSWRMNRYEPERGGVYRIRVLLGDAELGHADVITLRQRDIKAFKRVGSDLIPVSDEGNFDISFRIEEGVLEAIYCDPDRDLDFANCQVGVERRSDGLPTVVTVYGLGGAGAPVAAVITIPNGVFRDAAGNPLDEVVLAAELEVNPPSKELLLDDDQELPFFVEVNTFPGNVLIDPPGISVVICQEETVLGDRGIEEAFHPQLILYKVSDPMPGYPFGKTKRLATSVGAPECEGFAPAPAPVGGVVGMLRAGATRLMRMLGPEPVSARRLHGGLNTVVTRPSGLGEEAFSTFGSALGPNAAETDAMVPDGFVGLTTSMLIQVRNALGESLSFGGDDLDVAVTDGPNAGTPVTVTDLGGGLYGATYVPTSTGDDVISIVLVTADVWNQGPIGGSPYTSHVNGPELDQENLLDGFLVAPAARWFGRFDPGTGAPDPSGTSFDLQVAQPFAVGIGGTLSGIRLPIQNPSGATLPVTVEITRVEPGTYGETSPDDDQRLGSVTLPASAFSGVVVEDPESWAFFDLTGLDITVAAGEMLSFQVRTESPVPFYYPPEESEIYPLSLTHIRNFATGSTWNAYNWGLGFQTFVIP